MKQTVFASASNIGLRDGVTERVIPNVGERETKNSIATERGRLLFRLATLLVWGGVLSTTVLGVLCGTVSQTLAQDYPARYIRIVSPTAAGSPIDEYTRRLAKYLGERLKQTVIIENRPGGNTIIAAETVAKAHPDGYTLLFAPSSTLGANPHLFKKLSYDPLRDFVPVARLYTATVALAVPGNSPFRTVNDLVTAARANPGKLNTATASTAYRILSSAFHRAAGIDVADIGYKSAAAVVPDVMTGVVDYAVFEFSTIRAPLEAGTLRGVALLALKRSPLAPDIPTLIEAGLQDAAMVTAISQVMWAGLFAPAGTPAAIVETIERLSLEFVNSPDAIAFANQQGLMPTPGSAAELGKAVIADQIAWKDMIAGSGLEPQ